MENQNQVVKTVDWVLTLLITAIPVVGIVMLFVWAFGSETNPNKANWAKAMLIWIAIAIVLSIFFSLVFGAAFLAFL